MGVFDRKSAILVADEGPPDLVMIYPILPDADMLIGDKGYDSDAFREAH